MKMAAKYYLPMTLPIGKGKGFEECLKKLLTVFIISFKLFPRCINKK